MAEESMFGYSLAHEIFFDIIIGENFIGADCR